MRQGILGWVEGCWGQWSAGTDRTVRENVKRANGMRKAGKMWRGAGKCGTHEER